MAARKRMADKRATYIPGGNDDFYLPNVISPAPQRVMPEVPGNIQENLAHLELEANPVGRLSGLQSPAPAAEMQGSEVSPFPSRNSSIATPANSQGQVNRLDRLRDGYQQQDRVRSNDDNIDRPPCSPFPELRNRPANIPPSDEEREAILEKARNPVLNSNDPEMQLTWAQDALAYVEVATQDFMRNSETSGPRPQTPQVEHQLRVDAVNVVSFLADQQHPKADFIRGMWLEFGKFNFRMDRKEAYHCYSRAAQKGYARAEYRIGMQFENSNDPEKAIRHYELGVQAQDSASSYRMGMMHLLGQHGKPLDYERGVQLIKFASDFADENAPQGAYVYGMLQARELPQVDVPEQYLPFDLTAARFHIEKAAYLGFAKAQTKMGAAYELCQLGCDFNPAFSLHYNALAARQGESEAAMAISKWFLCGVEGVLEKNEDLAFTYARRAALTGLPTAEFAMGYFMEIGINTAVDLDEAKLWYRKAAEHGNKDAAARIEGISRSKTLSKKDHHGAAIAKIQSQYGSHRGKRPDRFKTTSTPMPTIADTGADMPNPDQFGSRSGTPQQRPISVAPYPEDDVALQPRQRPLYNPNNSSPDVRIGPKSVGGALFDSNFRGNSAASMRPPQQYPSAEILSPGRGRGTPFNNPPGGVGPGPGLQGYRQPSSGLSVVQKYGSHLPETPRPQSAGVPSIGYLGPIEPEGGKRLQKRGSPGVNPNVSALRPLPDNINAPGDRNEGQRLSRVPHSQTFAADSRPQAPYAKTGRPGSAGLPAVQSVSRHSAATQSPMPSPGTPLSRPNGLSTGPSLPPKMPVDLPVPTPPPNSIATKPPGKGPKTFEEMGVPQGKRDQDCAIEISANLHNKVTKTQAVKTLKELHEQQAITGKAAGKQIVYHTIQDPKDVASLEELATMDQEIGLLRESIATAKANEKLLKANLAAVNATVSTDDLRSQIITLDMESGETLGRLGLLRSGNVKPVSAEEKEGIDRTWRLWSRMATSRKRICMEMWSYCTQELQEGQTKEELWENLGLEEDQ